MQLDPTNLTLSIVEEVRRFVARVPPVDSTTGSAGRPRSFSARGDQRAETLPVQRPPAFAVGGHCMMRLMQILIFPFFPLSILDQLPLNRGSSQNADANKRYSLRDRPFFVRIAVILAPSATSAGPYVQ